MVERTTNRSSQYEPNQQYPLPWELIQSDPRVHSRPEQHTGEEEAIWKGKIKNNN